MYILQDDRRGGLNLIDVNLQDTTNIYDFHSLGVGYFVKVFGIHIFKITSAAAVLLFKPLRNT